MLTASVTATVMSVASWAAVFTGAWQRWSPAWAAMTGVIATLCWTTRWRQRQDERQAALDADRSLLLRTLAGVAVPPRPAAQTVRLHRVL